MGRNEAVGLAFKGKDEVTPVVRGIRTTMDRFKRDAATGFGLGAGISVFNYAKRAIGGVVDFLGDAVRAAAEEEAQIAQLTQAVAENDKAWDGNVDALEAVIRERQELAFSDGEQRESLRFLVSVTGDLTKALEVQRTAMDLARLKGLDLKTASDLLGKVYAGNLGTLSRYGIVLKKGATATEALAEIQRRATGQAETFAETSAGKGVRAQIAMADAMEDLGKAMTPVMAALAGAAADIIPAITQSVFDLGKAIGDVIAPHEAAVRELDGALREMAKELGLSEAAVMGFVNAQREVEEQSKRAIKAEQELQFAVEGFRNMLLLTATSAEEMEREVAEYEAGLRAAAKTTTDAVEVTGEQARITEMAAEKIRQFNDYVAAGGDVSRWLASGAVAAAEGIEAVADEADEAADEVRKLVDGLDLARGTFKDFWKGVREEQQQIRFFITHPGKLRQETDRIAARLEGLEAKKRAIEADGIQKRDRLALLAIDNLIAKLRGKQDQYRALGVLYGNATEAGMERAFDPNLIAEIRARRLPSRRDVLTNEGKPPGFADGGFIPPNATALVGERGPELLTMGSQGGFVTPNHQLGGGGPVYLMVDGAVLARSVDRRMGDTWALTRAGDYYRSSD